MVSITFVLLELSLMFLFVSLCILFQPLVIKFGMITGQGLVPLSFESVLLESLFVICGLLYMGISFMLLPLFIVGVNVFFRDKIDEIQKRLDPN